MFTHNQETHWDCICDSPAQTVKCCTHILQEYMNIILAQVTDGGKNLEAVVQTTAPNVTFVRT